MRIVAFRQDGTVRLGFMSGADVIDPLLALDAKSPDLAWLSDEAGRKAAERLIATAPKEARLPLEKLTLAAPMRLRRFCAAAAIMLITTGRR